MMMALTYSEITVAMAAPLTPSPRINIKIGSSIAFNRLPTPAKCKQHTVTHTCRLLNRDIFEKLSTT